MIPSRRLGSAYLVNLDTRETMTKKYSYGPTQSRGKSASARWRIFLVRNDNLKLKSAQNGRFGHPLTTGSTVRSGAS
jgi:hypothetical protein